MSARVIREEPLRPVTRAEHAQLVRRLYDESDQPPHKRRAMIVQCTGLSRSYVYELLNPKGERVLERKRRRKCEDCGKPIRSDSPGAGAPMRRCQACQRAYQRANAKWTRETIIDAIRRWVGEFGEPPSSSAWHGSAQANAVQWERFRGGDYPYCSQVIRRFGSWSAAIRAAGYECRRSGPRNRVSPEEQERLRRMRARGATWREIGDALGITAAAARARGNALHHNKKGVPVPTSLKAKTVIEREITRFRERKERATREAAEAAEQIECLELALRALSNGQKAA